MMLPGVWPGSVRIVPPKRRRCKTGLKKRDWIEFACRLEWIRPSCWPRPRRGARRCCAGWGSSSLSPPPASRNAPSAARPPKVTARVAGPELCPTPPRRLTIAADTAVVLDGEILGKPGSPSEALAMLRRLRNRAHRVLTAIAVAVGEETTVDVVTTVVSMRPYSEEEMAAYVASGDPYDKAGGYAVQHAGFRPSRASAAATRTSSACPSATSLPAAHRRRRHHATLPPALFRQDVGGRCPVALFPDEGDD